MATPRASSGESLAWEEREDYDAESRCAQREQVMMVDYALATLIMLSEWELPRARAPRRRPRPMSGPKCAESMLQ